MNRHHSVVCIGLLLLLLQARPDAIGEVDRLFGYGADLARERQVLGILESALNSDTNNYQLLWRATRSYYFVGNLTTDNTKSRYYEQGIAAGQRAIAASADGVEGHFWLGATYGAYAREKGAFKALGTVGKVRAEMETVIRLNPRYEDARGYLALGELDRQLPHLLGGNDKRAVQYLEDGLRIAPNNLEIKFALAQAYKDAGRKDDAKKQLQELLQMQPRGPRAHESRATQEKARELLAKMGG